MERGWTPGPWSIDKVATTTWQIIGKPTGFCADILADVHSADLYEGRMCASLIAAAPDLAEAAADALAGWRYIRQQHGDLSGVGWDRVEQALSAALAKASRQ